MDENASERPTASERALLRTLVFTDLVDSTGLLERLGDKSAAELFERHDRIARDLLALHGGREIDKSDGFLLLFERPVDAVRFSLSYHTALANSSREEGERLSARVGVHLGEVFLRESTAEDVARGAKPLEVDGLAKPLGFRLMSLAKGEQTLLTRGAFDVARRGAVGEDLGEGTLSWLAHGPFLFNGVEEPVEVFEVGVVGRAPLSLPPDMPKARSAASAGNELTLGWRPAAGQEIPRRRSWILDRKLGEGGFGEVWLAAHKRLDEERVFKFCFEADRLRGLRREVSLFRLMKEGLGHRDDIVRILDWDFEEAPYFLETDYTESGNLTDWAAGMGGIGEVPLLTRLELMAQVSDALAAAHSVGVLHKDVKPANILISADQDGSPRAILTDFGLGLVTDQSLLVEKGITVYGVTRTTSGTQMYMAPELLEGKVATVQADIYALGVTLYQFVTGDFERALAPGWQRDIRDEILLKDIAAAVDREPGKRLGDARQLADRLRSLEERRREHESERRAEAAALRMGRVVRWSAGALTVLSLVAGVAVFQGQRIARERDRANVEARTAESVTESMIDMFRMSDPDAAQGNVITAREILDRGTERIRTELADEPRVQASLLSAMGQVYLGLGLYDVAESLLEDALEARRELYGAGSPEAAEGLHDLASLGRLLFRQDTAEVLVREALATRLRHFGPDDLDVAASQDLLAGLIAIRGDADSAVALHRAALATRRLRLGEDHPDVVESLENVARTLVFYKPDAEGTVEAATEALEAATRLYGEQHTVIASALRTVSAAYYYQGDWARSEAAMRRVIQVLTALVDLAHPELMVARGNLALVLMERGELQEAEALIEESLEAASGRLPEDHQHVQFALAGLSRVQLLMGRFADAEETASRALALMDLETPVRYRRRASLARGEALAAIGRHAEAEVILLEVLEGLSSPSNEIEAARAREALAALVTVYESMDETEKAARYRRMLADRTTGA